MLLKKLIRQENISHFHLLCLLQQTDLFTWHTQQLKCCYSILKWYCIKVLVKSLMIVWSKRNVQNT